MLQPFVILKSLAEKRISDDVLSEHKMKLIAQSFLLPLSSCRPLSDLRSLLWAELGSSCFPALSFPPSTECHGSRILPLIRMGGRFISGRLVYDGGGQLVQIPWLA